MLNQAIFGLMVAFISWALVGRFLWAWLNSPRSDGPRIKRSFEGDGRRVTSVTRRGISVGHGRYPPVYRRYLVEVLRHDGATARFLADVESVVLGEAGFVDVDADQRRKFNQGSQNWFKDVESL